MLDTMKGPTLKNRDEIATLDRANRILRLVAAAVRTEGTQQMRGDIIHSHL